MPKIEGDFEVQDGPLKRFREKLEQSGGADDDDERDDEPEGPAIQTASDDTEGEVPVVSMTRREKKQERLKLRDELERLRSEHADLRAQMAREQGRFEGMQAVTPTGRQDRTDAVDPYAAELERLHTEHTNAYQLLMAKGANATQADRDAYTRKARDIEAAKVDVMVDKKLAQKGIERADPAAATRALLRMEFPDVYANQKAVDYAQAYFQMQLAAGKQDSKELLDESMAAARQQFRMNRQPAPTDRQRSQYAGQSPRGGGPAPREREDSHGESIRMTKPLRVMAQSRYPNLPENEAYKKWANKEGRAFLAAQRNGNNS